MYVCKSAALTGGEYKRLDKTNIEPGMVLERAPSGGLTLTTKSSSMCVVPANLKVDKSRTYSVAELADMAAITGTLAGRSGNAGDTIPNNIRVGMQVHFVAEADTELAEYLRAERANTTELWDNFLRQYPASARVGESRKALAKLITDEGDRHFADYRKSQEGGKPRFDELRQARVASQKALEVQKESVAAEKLRLNTDSELYRIVGLARSEFNAYLRAISEHTGGYAHLTQAQSHLQEVHLVDASYTAAEQLKIAVFTQAQEFNAAVQNAESLLAEKKFDAAYTSVVRYKGFAGEVPRVAAVVDAAFEYHRNLGRQFVNEANWELNVYMSSKKKKEVSDTSAVVTETEKKLTDGKKSLDQIPETTMEEIILPYNYTRRTIQLNAVVEISFRISESSSESRGAMDSVHVEIPNKVIVLENVKPEDTDRIVEEGITPDEVELRRRSENQASDELLKKLIQRLNEVPQKVIEQARAYASAGDSEAAAEKYVLYLNTTEGKPNQERTEAQEFLRKEFNVNSLTAQ